MSRLRKFPARQRKVASTFKRRLQMEALEERQLLALAIAGQLLVSLDARDPSAGTASWVNTGTLPGNFTEVGNPQVVSLGPNFNPAVNFNPTGNADAYTGPIAPATITGAGARTIETWVFNPTVDGEESLVTYGRRGGPDGTNYATSYGNNTAFGAVGAWGGGPDMPFGPSAASAPPAGQWHHLVYTYDGVTNKVYEDGALKFQENVALNTYSGAPIRLAAQTLADGVNIDLGENLDGELAIGTVRIHQGALTAAQVQNNYNEEAVRFAKLPVVGAPAPIHRYAFNDAGNPGLDSIAGANATLTGAAAIVNGQLDLTGGFASLPLGNEINTYTNATFETWFTFRGGGNWQRVFDLGTDTNNYAFLTPQSGDNTTYFEIKSPPSGVLRASTGTAPLNTQVHMVGVVDDTRDEVRLYVNGQLVSIGANPNFSFATLGGSINYFLGKSQFADPAFNGSINEFRIYNQALTSAQVQASFTAGPDDVQDPVTAVNDSFTFTEDTLLTAPTIITSHVVPAGTVGNQAYGGTLGMDFNVQQTTSITHLGVFDDGSNGLARVLNAYLFDRNTQQLLATIQFSPGDPGVLEAGNRFKELSVPIVLPAGFQGTIVADGYGVGEQNGNNGTPPWTTNSGGGILNFVGSSRFGNAGQFPGTPDGGPLNRYAAGTLKFTAAPNSILVNDTNPDNDPLRVTTTNVVSTQGIPVVISPRGSFVYDPRFVPAYQALAVGQQLVDTFQYTVTDDRGSFSTGTVTLTITGVNDPPVAVADGQITPINVPLQSATAFGTQAGFSVAALIDGVLPGANSTSSWANDLGGVTPSNTAVFETTTNLNPTGLGTVLTFNLTSGDFGKHLVGNFRISYTTDDRSTFADGLANGGDVTANWTVLTPLSVSTSGTSTFTIRPDGSILGAGVSAERETYSIRAFTTAANITGFRLEAIESGANDISNGNNNGVSNGPGRSTANNGNFVAQEFAVIAQVGAVPLQSATAQFTQAGFSIAATIDGNANPPTNSTASWADAGSGGVGDTANNVAVYETAQNLNPLGQMTLLTFNITSGDFTNHLLGNLRLSITTDDRSFFADGLANGGDVTANWIQLTPESITTTGTSSFTIRPNNTILAGGTPQNRETYTIRALTNVANITGFRLELLEDVSLPGNGPGRGPTNGNFVMQEFQVVAQPGVLVVSEDGSSTLDVLANDIEIDDGDTLTIVAASGTTQGTLVNNGNNLTYTPGAAAQALTTGQTLLDTFTYTISDFQGALSTTTATILIVGVNDAPVAVDDAALTPIALANASVTFEQGAPFVIANSINGVDTENAGWAIFGQQTQNQTAVFQTASPVELGPISLQMFFNSPNAAHKIQNFRLSVTNSPNPTVNSGATWVELAPTAFATSSPGSDLVLQANNRLQVTGSVAVPDSYLVTALNSLAGVTGIRLEAFTVGGTVGFNSGGGNGNIVMTEFRARTGVTTSEDAAFNGSGLLLNDTDVDGPSALTVSPTGPRLSALGAAVTVNADGTFTYNPIGVAALQALAQGQSVTDTFTYTATDGVATSNVATASITVIGANDAPTASAGGPYTIAEGQALQLAGTAADPDNGATLTIGWDLNNDGVFTDATGANPSVSWATLVSLGINNQATNLPISLRVSDGIAPPVVVGTTLTVTNVAPTLVIDAQSSAVPGEPVDFTFTATDPSPVDQAAMFTFTIDWDGDGSVDETVVDFSPLTISHVFPAVGDFTVRARARDVDGAQGAEATHDISVSRISEENGVVTLGADSTSDRIIIGPGNKIRYNGQLLDAGLGNASLIRIFGNDGNDTVTVSAGVPAPVELYGGNGNDYLTGGGYADTLDGGDGNDRLLGGNGNDFIYGGAGRDVVSGGNGNDYIEGGEDFDNLKGDAGNDIIFGGDGNDTIVGGTGSDILHGDAGVDNLDGGDGNDALSGDDDGDKLYGRNGLDVLIGGGGSDQLFGGGGEDLIIGGNYFDTSDFGLMALLADWTSGGSFATRTDNLFGTLSLDVDDDGSGDTLNGEGGNDWYLIFALDLVNRTDAKSPNRIDDLS